MVKNKMNFMIVGIYAAAMMAISIFQIILIIGVPEILENDALFVTFNSVTNLLLYLSLFLIFAYTFRHYLKVQLLNFFTDRNRYFVIICAGFGFMILASIGSSFILEFLGVTETSSNQEALNMLMEGNLFDQISLLVFSILLVPLVEELVFRKAILDLFHINVRPTNYPKFDTVRKIISGIIAITISSLAFGFIHIMSFDPEQLVQIIYYAGLGAILGTAYLLSNKNIFVSITMHFLLNLFVSVLTY